MAAAIPCPAAVGYWIHRSTELFPPLPEPGKAGSALALPDFQRFVEEKRGLVLDSRAEAEYREGRLPGAWWLPIEDFDLRYEALKAKMEADKARPIVICRSNFFCKRSATVQKKLRALDYANVSVFSCGWSAWRQAGLPEEK